MKKIYSLITILMLCLHASAQNDSEYNPTNPSDPAANLWNPATGEVYLDLFEPGYMSMALNNLLGSDENIYMSVKTFTVVTSMSQGDYRYIVFPNCETVDLGRATGSSTVPANAFQMLTNLRTLILPSCIQQIGAPMPPTLEQLDIYATTPPTVLENIWQNLTDKANLVVRVPAGSVDAYRSAALWKEVQIRSLDGSGGEETESRSIQMTVLTPDGQDVTSQVSIAWFSAGTLLGEGRTLESIKVGTTVSYRITLSNALSLDYQQPAEGSYTVRKDGNTIRIVLEATAPVVVEEKNLQGSEIELNIQYQAAGDTPFNVPANDLLFQVFRNGEELTDFVFLSSTLRFENSTFSDNDECTIRVSSRTGIFQQTEVSANPRANILLKECGIAQIDFTAQEGVTDVQCTVFDSQGRYAGSYPNEGTTCTVNGLPDGTYTAVLMQKSQFFARMQQLSDMAATGLRAGTDYTQLNIQQEAGATKTYTTQVPALDDTPYRHTAQEASFTSNNASVNVGFYTTLKAKVQFKEEFAAKVSNVSLIIDIPDGCSYVNNSLLMSKSEGNFSREGKRLVVPVQTDETVRFCIVPERAGEHAPAALLRYSLGGKQYQQPLGTAWVEGKALEIDGQEIIITPTFIVSGTAPGGKKMVIYDGTQKLGEATALSSGEWKATVTLPNPISHTFHRIYAQYENEAGSISRTETMDVLYDENAQAAILSRIEIKTQSQTITYNCLTDVLTPKYYTFNPNRNQNFTFTAKMMEDQPEKIRNAQFYVDLSDGNTSVIDATYNEQQKLWTSNGFFPSEKQIPVSTSFCFDYLTDEELDATALENAEVQQFLESSRVLNGVLEEEYFHMDELLEDSEDRVRLLFHIGNDDESLYIDYQMVDFSQAEALAVKEKGDALTVDEDHLVCFTQADDDWIRTYYLDYSTKEAWYVFLGTKEMVNKTPQPKEMTFLGLVSGAKKAANLIGKFGKGFKSLGENVKKEVKDFVQDKKDLMFAEVYYQELVSLRDQYAANLGTQVWACVQALGARCPDGDWKVRAAVHPAFQRFIQDYNQDAEQFIAIFDSYIAAYEKAVIARCGAEYVSAIGTFVGGKVATGAAVKGRHVIGNITKIAPKFGTYKEVTKFVADGAADGLKQIIKELGPDTDFMAIKNFICRWAPKRYFLCADHLLDLLSDIKSAYQKCKEDEDDDEEDPEPDPKPKPKRKPRRRPQPKIINIRPIIDPSGFVYEAVPENRVEGVTATIYYSETNPGMSAQSSANLGTLWDAEEYGQQNPLQTDKEGLYSWDVPQGWWQVRFEKEGYESTQTQWLPVPPPQLEVNIPMVQKAAPTVEKATAYPNAISITFNKFMQTSTLTGFRLFQNGYSAAGSTDEIPGHIEAVEEKDGLAKQVRFIPEGTNGELKKTTVTLRIPAAVKSYAGTTMNKDWEQELKVENNLDELIVEDNIQLSVGLEGTFDLWCSPSPAGMRPEIEFDSDFLTLANAPVFDEAGKAVVKMQGLLPGSTDVTLRVGELSVTTTVSISYDHWKTVCNPMANILSGTAVAKGTAIELLCPTEGATIYYTLDGSCPCDDSASRIEYDGTPIVVDKDITIRAIAMMADMLDSEVIDFKYTLATGIQSLSSLSLPEAYFTLSGTRALPPLKPGLYIQRTKSGTRKIRIR